MSWLVILPLVSILGYVAALVRRNLLGWSIAPISVISSIVLVLFLSDFLSLLRPVSLVITLAGAGLLLVECARYVKLHGFYFQPVFLWGLGSVGLATAILADYNSTAQFVSWDMFSHWGTIIKLVEFTNTALDLKNQGYRLYFQDYPPGTAYLGYFFLRFTGFHENIALMSHAVLLMFAAMPAIAASNTSYRLHALLLAVTTFILIILMGQGWSSILIDQIVGVLFGSALSIYWVTRNNPKAWWALPPIFGFLVLAKDSGASFTIAAIALIVVAHWYRMRTAPQEVTHVRGVWKTILVCIVVPIVISQFWAGHVKRQALDASLAGMSITKMLKQSSQCCSTEREQAIISAFSERMIGLESGSAEAGITKNNSLVNVLSTRWDAPGKLLFALLLIGLIICSMQQKKVDRSSYGLLVFGVAVGGIAYCFLMLLYYLYGFSDYEGRVLTSLERYFGSYALGMAFLLLAGAATLPFNSKGQKITGISLFALLIIPCLLLGRTSIQSYLWAGGPEYFPTRDELVTPLVHPFVDKSYPRVSVLVVWQADKPSYVGLEYWILRYELTPRTTQAGSCFSFGPPLYAGDSTTCNWSEEAFVNALGNYHYVFVGNGLQSLQRAYPSVFEGANLPGNSAVLSVKQSADGKHKLKQWQQ